ncbi:unnamed protein product [Brassica rapa]|uniref:Uncharacterized protein n=1 Tax=Brassica campestris TaxID=3711 RepID=A0A3P6BMQ9_BRACM|nr:unnamed protein product [Brassica rapa]VDD02194.1 unnamed protein product [Brassica rapa]
MVVLLLRRRFWPVPLLYMGLGFKGCIRSRVVCWRQQSSTLFGERRHRRLRDPLRAAVDTIWDWTTSLPRVWFSSTVSEPGFGIIGSVFRVGESWKRLC